MKEKVLITGGAGFIGSHTADLLNEKGYSVRILDNLSPSVHEGEWPGYVKGKGFELIKGDVTNKEDLLNALKGVDYVIHLAAFQDQLPNFSKFFLTNTVSTALIYELIHTKNLPIKKVIYSSSQFVYGDGFYKDSEGNLFMPELRSLEQFKQQKWDVLDKKGNKSELIPFKEDQELNPTNSYGLSKVAAEKLILRMGKTYNIPSSIARYSIVQGPRQSPRNLYSGVLRIFVTQALSSQPLTVHEDGNQLRDFVNVYDVAKANLLLMENQETNFQIYNIGGGKGYTILSFAELVKKITGTSSEIIIEGFRKTDTRNAVSDTSKLSSLGWTPQYTPEKAIKDYVSWIKEENFDLSNVKKSKEERKKLGVVDA